MIEAHDRSYKHSTPTTQQWKPALWRFFTGRGCLYVSVSDSLTLVESGLRVFVRHNVLV